MKYFTSILVAFTIVSLQASCSNSKPTTIKELDGHWVRKKYVDTLAATYSPFTEEPESVTISDQNGHFRLDWTNFHEGTWRKITRLESTSTGCVLVVGNWENESPRSDQEERVPIRIVRDPKGKVTSIEFLDNSLVVHKNELFIWVPAGLETIANEVVLAGTYVDPAGKTFFFSKEGMASWPNRSFPYKVALDSSEAGCDYFKTPDDKEPGYRKRYGFKRNRDSLQLFQIVYDRKTPIECEERPFVTLVRR